MKKLSIAILSALLVTACTSTKQAATEKAAEPKTTTKVNTGIDRSVRPTPGPAPKVKITKPEEFKLANGLHVMVVENHKLPSVSFYLSMDNPPLLQGNKKGVFKMLSAIMGNGTSKISKDDFNEELEFYGANASVYASGASATTLTRYFPKVFDLVISAALDPRLSKTEFEKEKEKALENLRISEKNVQSVANNLRSALAFGKNHPYGEFTTEKTLQNVTFNDVKNYYNKYFSPENAYLVVVGDVTLAQVKKLVEKDLASWKPKGIKKVNYAKPQNLPNVQIDFIDMPNAVQTEIAALNVVDLKIKDKDYFAAVLANKILGGGGEARLFLNLREAHGWTYGAYSDISPDKEIGSFSATAAVRNAVTDSAVVEMMNEIRKIGKEPVTQDELDRAKATYIGSFVMNAQKPSVIANQALQIQTQGLPADFYENFIKNISAVTLEEVQAVAKKYFGADNSRIVVVGKAEDVLPGLEKLGYPINFYNRFGEKTGNPLKNQVALPAGLTAQKVLADYVQAIGGVQKVKNIKSVKATFTLEGAAPQPLEGEVLYYEPNLEKTVLEMNGAVIVTTIFDGKVEKTSGMMGNSEKSGKDVAEKAAKKGIVPQAFYTNKEAKLVGTTTIDGKLAYKVEVPVGDLKTYEYYDAKSKLLVQNSVSVDTPQGPMEIITSYKDYKSVDGVKFAFVVTQEVAGQKIVTTMKKMEVNKDVKLADFK
uniref:M16 family metallopeptidase n=1 Tax=Ornithobacterium rhinotracheale TaxID=28251 RepID=UPI0039A5CBC9